MAVLLMLILNLLELSIPLLVFTFASENSLVRPALLPLLGYLTIYTLPLNRSSFPNKVISNLLDMNTCGLFLQYLDFGLLSRWTFAARGPTSPLGGQRNAKLSLADRKALEPRGLKPSSLWTRLQWGLFAATAWRAPATLWEVKGTPPFKTREPPSRLRFIFDNVITLVLCYLVLDAMSLGEHNPEENAVNFAWEKVRIFTRLGAVSTKEIKLRITVVLMCWVSAYCALQASYSLGAIIAVATHMTTVKVWPPLFGSLTESWSVRQHWGSFWHQAVRQKISAPAYYATYSLLGLRKGGMAARYTNILLTFIVSGLLHRVAEEYADAVPWSQSGTMRFYCIQAFGILLEDAFQGIFHTLTTHQHSRWTRAVGYIWVTFWIVWVSPALFYPRLELSKKETILPSSVVGPLMKYLTA